MKTELRAVSTELPDPPYPEDTKANGWRPEFDIRRIKASRTWRLAGADTRNALLRLWLECWENIPVGTWPDDSEVIAISIDVSVDWFEGHRKRLMSGWVMHSDGNLYHPYITEMVLGMLGKRRSSAERKARSRAKNNGNVTGMSRVTSCESHGSHAQEQEQEQETGEKKKKNTSLRDFAPVEKLFHRIHELGGPENGLKTRTGSYSKQAENAYRMVQEHGLDVAMAVVEFKAKDLKRGPWKDCADPFKKFFNAMTLFRSGNFPGYVEQVQSSCSRNKSETTNGWGLFS